MRFKLLLILLPLILSSCGTDSSSRTVYLAAKYKLTYAAIVPGYKIDTTPYFTSFRKKPGYVDYISSFNKENSMFNIETKINDKGEPYGIGTVDIAFKNATISSLSDSYSYRCSYDGVYGGNIIMDKNTKPHFLGDISYRMRYWWVRMEAWLPQVTDERLILEFQYYEMNDEPVEFDHKIW